MKKIFTIVAAALVAANLFVYDQVAEKLLIDGQLYVKYKGQMYNVQGQVTK